MSLFRLQLAEAESGILLNADGSRHLGTAARFEPTFATREDAVAFKNELLRKFPFAEVWLVEDGSETESERFVDQVRLDEYLAARRS